MGSDIIKAAEEIALRAGAIIPCPQCGIFTVGANDAAATDMACALATRAWRAGYHRFYGVAYEDVIVSIKAVIQDANWECAGCRPLGGD